MKILIAVIFLIPIGILGQIGIKTKQFNPNNQAYELYSLSQYQNSNRTSGQYYNTFNGTGSNQYGSSHHINSGSNYNAEYPHLPLQPAGSHIVAVNTVDNIVQFLNETRSKMASGVCFKEVPTASLVGNRAEVPKGNGSDASMSKIRICCEGYERNVHNFLQCDPVCKNDCINGICVSPDVCVCYPDHIRNYAGYCLPTCPIGCGNGLCQDDGTCLCKPGYKLDFFSKKFCAPICSNGCRNGNCTAPEVCECSPRFELDDNGICTPKCDNCENGKCIEPGVCTCLSGYQRMHDKCEPICSKECKNGFCAAPEICGCNGGMILDASGSNCVAHCDKPCLNGFCSGNNVCSCHNGYVLDELNPNLCRPHCPGGCPNGYCTSPNLCLCKIGFIKSGVKGRTQCVPV